MSQIVPDANPSYSLSLTKPTSGTLTIADDTRQVIAGPIDILTSPPTSIPFNITYDALLAATHAQPAGAITFKITKVLTGTFQKSDTKVVPNRTTLSPASLLPTPPPVLALVMRSTSSPSMAPTSRLPLPSA